MRRTAMLASLLFCALLSTACGGAGNAAIIPNGGAGNLTRPSFGEEEWNQRVLDLTNQERAAHGLQPLVLDEQASVVAYEHAWDMDLRNFFDHENPDGEGPAARLARHGIEFQFAGENIARGHASPEAVVRAWMESPGHRLNLLYPGWKRVGIAVHSGGAQGPWWAQEFFR